MLTAAVLGLLAASTVRIATSPYGAPVDVLVAARDLAPGEALTDADLRRTTWPADLVPADVRRGAGGTVTAPVPAGSVVTERHVGEDAIAAALPPGHVAVPLPRDALPALSDGSRVDLVTADLEARGVRLAADALVLGGDPEVVWVAVMADEAAAVAGAAAQGAVVPVLRP